MEATYIKLLICILFLDFTVTVQSYYLYEQRIKANVDIRTCGRL